MVAVLARQPLDLLKDLPSNRNRSRRAVRPRMRPSLVARRGGWSSALLPPLNPREDSRGDGLRFAARPQTAFPGPL